MVEYDTRVKYLKGVGEARSKELSKLGTGSIYTCHNTGRKGYDIMKEILGDRLQYLRAGEELEF